MQVEEEKTSHFVQLDDGTFAEMVEGHEMVAPGNVYSWHKMVAPGNVYSWHEMVAPGNVHSWKTLHLQDTRCLDRVHSTQTLY